MKMKRLFLFPIFVAALAAVASSAAFAQEDVCDMESGAAFGLCNAYCEAMDCDLANDDDPNTAPAASTLACLKVYDNFMQLRGTAPPCEAALGFCGDGVADVGEQCDDGNTVSGDGCDENCIIEGGAWCGNNICEAGDGENCENCAADCNGAQSGRPANQFCCGQPSSANNPLPCSDALCSTGGYSCTDIPAGPVF